MNGAKPDPKGGISIDFSDFDSRFKDIVKNVIPKHAKHGLFAAGNELIHDAINVPPQAPFREGHLHGSQRIETPEEKTGEIELKAGFTVPYAAKWHEVPEGKKINWTTDKRVTRPGRKYLELKMSMYKDKYAKIIADDIKDKK